MNRQINPQVSYRFRQHCTGYGRRTRMVRSARWFVDDPVLVIVNGSAAGEDRVRWRVLGTLMVVTSLYFDSDIVGAWNYGIREELIAQFPERSIIEMVASGNDVWLVDE